MSHADFADSSELPNAVAIRELRAQTHVTKLTRGYEITGYVMDTNRAPISGARVIFDRQFSATGREATTDSLGQYHIAKAKMRTPVGGFGAESSEEVVNVTAFSEKHAPVSQKIKLTEPVTRLDFTLAPGQIIRGHVVDPDGKAIEGAGVSRGTSSLQRDDAADWRGKTDASGNFEWRGSPAGPQRFSFGATGFVSMDQVLEPGETVHTVTLKRESSISGRVIDGETQQPVTHFFAISGESFGRPARLSGYSPSDEKEFNDAEGKFELTPRRDRENAVQARAQGYLTGVTVWNATNRDALVIALRKSSAFAGRVVDRSGAPAAGITVAAGMSGPGNSIQLDRNGISRITRVDRTVTDANGEFNLEPATEIGFLVAADAQRFTQISVEEFQQTKTIVLQPHGRIEGNLRIGKNVGADQPLSLNMGRAGMTGVYFQIPEFLIKTDGQGKFVFEGVPAGQLSISQVHQTSATSWSTLRSTMVEVKPGETAQLTIGGDGTSVKGRLQWPAGVGREFTNLTQMCDLRDIDPATIVRSPNGVVPRYYSFRIQEDGRFEAADIPQGNYELIIELREETPGGRLGVFGGKPIGTFQREIQINGNAEDIDLGEIVLSDKPVMRRGL